MAQRGGALGPLPPYPTRVDPGAAATVAEPAPATEPALRSPPLQGHQHGPAQGAAPYPPSLAPLYHGGVGAAPPPARPGIGLAAPEGAIRAVVGTPEQRRLQANRSTRPGSGLRRTLAGLAYDPEVLRAASERTPEFMRASEVMRRYAPIPGDFEGVLRPGPPTAGGTPTSVRGMETEEELWARKLDEARRPTPPDPSSSLFNQIASAGRVLSPIQLSTVRAPSWPGATPTGSEGRRVVLGGHHRLAVANALGLEVPVLHYHGYETHFNDPEYLYQETGMTGAEGHARYELWKQAQQARMDARRIQRETRSRGAA